MDRQFIKLFVMHGCQVCPQMERLFHDMHNKGAIDELEIIDIGDHPEIAQKHNVRSVPYYLINGVAFDGVKTAAEIKQLLHLGSQETFQKYIKSELSEGQLGAVETIIRENSTARDAMMLLLGDADTTLVVRIGLTAIIESLAEGGLLQGYQQQFIGMASDEDERVAIDAIYYLSLLGTPETLEALVEISNTGKKTLRIQAVELLEELNCIS